MTFLLSTRSQRLLEWVLLAGAVAPLGACDSASGGDRPNVVLITLDTLRADQLKAYGHPDDGAPFLSELARNGVVFERAYSSSSWTAPSTASLLTGVYPDRHGVDQGFLIQLQGAATADEIRLQTISESTPTLAQVLQDAGYATFGAAANVNIGAEMEFDRGFDRFERERQMSAERMGELVLGWKEELRSSQPFFLYLHLNDVHKPYDLRQEWYVEAAGEPAATRALYRSELGYMDHFLGRLWQELALDGDDLVVVVSDHGEEFLDHGNWGHHFSLYDELNRIVFFAHGPGLGLHSGKRVVSPVSIIDVAPTILALLGLESVIEPDGVSLAFTLHPAFDVIQKGPGSAYAVSLWRPLFAHRVEGGRELWSVIDGEWKLIEGPDGVELYQIEDDPGETRDLAQEKPEVVGRLRATLEEHQVRAARQVSGSVEVPLDPDLLKHLQDIGYAH